LITLYGSLNGNTCMPSVQLIVLIVYFAGLFGVGRDAARFIGSNTDFLLAGRRLAPVPLSTCSPLS